MAGFVPAIHVFVSTVKVVDGRHKAGHDGRGRINADWYGSHSVSGRRETALNFFQGLRRDRCQEEQLVAFQREALEAKSFVEYRSVFILRVDQDREDRQ